MINHESAEKVHERAEHVHEITGTLHECAENGTPVRIHGGGHWMFAGRPVDASRVVSLAGHTGVVDYVPGDLTITVKSGTTLAEIERVTRAEGQWLPLNPCGSSDGTIGATIATGSFGSLAHGFGRARDLVLGTEFVTGEGKTVRGGGRVVKNVAGFDLVRLITGSWGTLGVITELTMRLYSRPRDTASLLLSVPGDTAGLSGRISSILKAPVSAMAIELVNPAVASAIGLPPRDSILVELGGNSASVRAQRAALEAFGGVTEIESPLRRLREVEGSGELIVIRLSSLPGRIGDIWTATANAVRDVEGAMMHATPSLGIIRCILPAGTSQETIGRVTTAGGDVTVIHETLPASMWRALSPSVVSDPLSQGILKAFDPAGILNPGIMGPSS